MQVKTSPSTVLTQPTGSPMPPLPPNGTARPPSPPKLCAADLEACARSETNPDAVQATIRPLKTESLYSDVVQIEFRKIIELRLTDPIKAVNRFLKYLKNKISTLSYNEDGFLYKGFSLKNFKATGEQPKCYIISPFSFRKDSKGKSYLMVNIGPEDKPFERSRGAKKTVRTVYSLDEQCFVVMKKPIRSKAKNREIRQAENNKQRKEFIKEHRINKRLGRWSRLADFTSKGLYLISDIMEGDALQYLNTLSVSRSTLPASLPLHLVKKMAQDLDKVHKAGIIHADVKLENFLISQTEDEYVNVQLDDFGMSIELKPGEVFRTMDRAFGTPAMMAPELISSHRYSKESDIYAYGALLLQMLCDTKAFYSSTPNTPYFSNKLLGLTKNKSGTFLIPSMKDSDVSAAVDAGFGKCEFPTRMFTPLQQDTLKQIIKDCLKRDPASRCDIATIISRIDAVSGHNHADLAAAEQDEGELSGPPPNL